MVVVVLALAPDLAGAVGPAFGTDEGEAVPALHDAVVRDGEPRGVAERDGPPEEDHERVAVPPGSQRTAADPRDTLEDELGARVEDHRIESGAARDEGRCHFPVERGRIPIEVRELDALMDEIVVV